MKYSHDKSNTKRFSSPFFSTRTGAVIRRRPASDKELSFRRSRFTLGGETNTQFRAIILDCLAKCPKTAVEGWGVPAPTLQSTLFMLIKVAGKRPGLAGLTGTFMSPLLAQLKHTLDQLFAELQ